MIRFLSLLCLVPVYAHSTCDLDLRVIRGQVVRSGVTSTEYRMAVDPKKHVVLRVTSRIEPLSRLRNLGLHRLARATRALNLDGPVESHLEREVRINELHFMPSSKEELLHRYPSPGTPVLKQFRPDFEARELLLEEALRDRSTVPDVYQFSFNGEILTWREVLEMDERSPTRFATQTWIARFFRRHGVKGAVMVGGEVPQYQQLPDGARHPAEGPTVLFFRPARR